MRDALSMMLSFEGHSVETAQDGQEALALFQKGSYDLVITDYEMPLMRGDELALAIKARNPTQRIMMVTAYAESLTNRKGGIPGIEYLLAKPFLYADLRTAFKAVCGED